MSVQLILGNSGAGKSHYIYNKIIGESMAHPDREYLVIVPEQFTMQTQKELVGAHPGGGILNIDVLSFQRLAWRVFEEVGGDSRKLLEETGKTLVLQKVIQMNRRELTCLGSRAGKPGYIQELKSLISELMQYDVQDDQMDEMLKLAEEKTLLHQKLRDVEVLYGEFRDYLRERFLTAEEVLDVLCEKLPLSAKLAGSTVVFDGFTGFTPIQYNVLERLMRLCRRICITVTIDAREDPFASWKPYELFAMSKQMIRSVRDVAAKAGAKLLDPVRILPGEHSRFAESPALGCLEKSLFRYGRDGFAGETEEIRIFEAPNPLLEMTEVSRRIARLVREEGCRYRDIAVITGDLETYGNYAERVFSGAGIPCFIDRKHSVLMNPFVEFIRSALDVMVQNFSYASVFRHLRCGLSDLDADEVDRLENYVIALGIRGRSRWAETWVRTYRGMREGEILEINALRERAMDGLFAFADAFKRRGNRVADDTRALYDYIVGCRIQVKLDAQRREFARRGDAAMEREYAQIYGIIMNLLDKLVEILGEETISQRDYVQLMEAGLSEATVGIIPPSADQVLVGDMERTRLVDIRALFFVGVNDGIIPKNSGRGGLLSEPDREFFLEQGIALAPTPREAMYMQRFYLYLNLTKPRSRLVLSYSQANAAGEALGPAYLIGMVQNLFPALEVERTQDSRGDVRLFERPWDSLPTLLAGMRGCALEEPDDGWKELYAWFDSRPEYRGFLHRLVDAAFTCRPEDRLSAGVARAVYGEIPLYGATRLEQFAACAFAHFLRYGLALGERPVYEFTPLDMGNVMHGALEHFSSAMAREGLTWRTLTEESRDALVEESVERVVHDYGNTILHSSAREEYRIERIRRILNRTVWALQSQMGQGKFEPEGVEVVIGGGRIDRMDVWETEDKVYVKIVDYKTGNTTFDLLGIYHGLQLQLMVYLEGALELEREKHPDKEVEPAGVFYYHVQDPMVQALWNDDREELDKLLRKRMRMSGLVTSDENVLRAMDPSLESLPVSFTRSGDFSSRSSVAGKWQFTLLEKYVDGKIRELREKIEDGDVQIAPYRLDKREGCTWCPYRSVCGFDRRIPGYRYRNFPKLDKSGIWNIMREEASEWE